MNFNNGNDNNNNKSSSYYVRAVRGGKCSLLSFSSLFASYLDCRRRKRGTIHALKFEYRLLDNLFKLALELQRGTYRPSRSVCFVTTTPKLREIFAADFRDRIVHHLVVRELEKIWEPKFIHDSHASRKGKGTHAAVQRLQGFMRKATRNGNRAAWYLQIDIRSFFMSIDKEILFQILAASLQHTGKPVRAAHPASGVGVRSCADSGSASVSPAGAGSYAIMRPSRRSTPLRAMIERHRRTNQCQIQMETPPGEISEKNALLYLLHRIIFHDCTENYLFKGDPAMLVQVPAHKSLFQAPKNKGLPIGNLTSQFFANVYLNELDQFVKHRLKCRWYIRYVDDCVLLASDRQQLMSWQGQIEDFLRERLALRLKEGSLIRRVSEGADFLGYIVRPDYLLVRRRVVNNLKAKLAEFEQRIITRYQAGDRQVIKIDVSSESAVRLRQTLASYLGHYKHASSHRLVQGLFRRYTWLNELFFIDGCRLYDRYHYKGVFRRLRQQVGFFRSRLPGVILLCRVGRYVEAYGDDACRVAALLRLKMRTTHRGMENMVGFPHWYRERFLDRLLAAGHDVAVIGQGIDGPRLKERFVRQVYRQQMFLSPAGAGSYGLCIWQMA